MNFKGGIKEELNSANLADFYFIKISTTNSG